MVDSFIARDFVHFWLNRPRPVDNLKSIGGILEGPMIFC